MNAQDVISHLKVRFEYPSYCFLEQVADATGARHNRWADAIAMSVWPSRGYDIHGIEVKVSKYDWLNELKKPEKSAAVQQYCNRWWIATPDETIIAAGELPPTWGWMVCKGSTMRVVKEAPLLTPKAVSVEFVASVLRNFAKAEETLIEQRIQKAVNEAKKTDGEYYRSQYANIKKSVQDFEQASGIRLNEYVDGKDLGDAVATLRNLKWRVEQVSGAIKACQDIEGMLLKVQDLSDLKETIASTQTTV